jgi:transposase
MNVDTVIDILCDKQGRTRKQIAVAAKVNIGTAKYWINKAAKEGKVRCVPQRTYGPHSPRFRYWVSDHFYNQESEVCKER